ncbi:MAG: hypothetical protein NVS3B20_17170 [Polyangiales bacterium]
MLVVFVVATANSSCTVDFPSPRAFSDATVQNSDAPNDAAVIGIAYRSASGWNSGNLPDTSILFTAPSVVADGDVLIASIMYGNSTLPSAASLSAPAGWTLVRQVDGGALIRLAVYWHVFTSAETSYQWTPSLSVYGAGWIAAYHGVDALHPVDVDDGYSDSKSATSYATPSITTNGPREIIVATFAGFAPRGFYQWINDSGMTQRTTVDNGTGRTNVLFDAMQAQPGPTGVRSATANAKQTMGVTHLLALRPMNQ